MDKIKQDILKLNHFQLMDYYYIDPRNRLALIQSVLQQMKNGKVVYTELHLHFLENFDKLTRDEFVVLFAFITTDKDETEGFL